jgi:hypothetical protein
MTTDQFWTIVGASRDKSSDVNEQKLFEHLCVLTEQQIIAFDRLWKEHSYRLYTNPLWGVVHLARHGCSEERFEDWRNWFVSRGREVFEAALNHPDDLVPLIDSEPEAGARGLVEVIARALRARNSRWEDSMPDHAGLTRPSIASGPEWGTDEDLKSVLPKTYARYTGKDPGPVAPAPVSAPPAAPAEISCGPSPVRPPSAATREVKEIPVTQSPVKKPWWKVWG